MKVVPKYEESELLQQVAKGNEKAFTELFNEYSDLLAAVIYRFTNSNAVTEDIVQEIFLKVWMGRESLAGVTNFKAYLYVIARNQALNAVRKAINERKLYRQSHSAVVTGDEEILQKKEREVHFSLLDEAIAHLPAQQQKVFLLSRRDRMKHEAIAKEMGISKATVKKYMQLAIASISKYMKGKITILLLLLLR